MCNKTHNYVKDVTVQAINAYVVSGNITLFILNLGTTWK